LTADTMSQYDTESQSDIPSSSMESLKSFVKPLLLSAETVKGLSDAFLECYYELAQSSDTNFLPTPIQPIQKVDRSGTCLAIDIGGTNLRISWVDFTPASPSASHLGNSAISRDIFTCHITPQIRSSSTEDFFQWVGDHICQYITTDFDKSNPKIPQRIAAGVTFSFPMQQIAISKANLLGQGKGFFLDSNSEINEILTRSFDTAKKRYSGLSASLNILAIANDTVSTLAAANYPNVGINRVAMSIIVGTGTNVAAFLPWDIFSAEKVAGISRARDDEIAVNTELGINGTLKPLQKLGIITKWDTALFHSTEKPDFMPFEYMTAGRYLGELVRLILLDWLDSIGRTICSRLEEPYSLSTTFVSELQKVCRATNASLAMEGYDHLEEIEYIGSVIGTRTSQLLASACFGLVQCGDVDRAEPFFNKPGGFLDSRGTIIAATGSVIQYFPGLRKSFEDNVNALIAAHEGTLSSPENKIEVQIYCDASLVGAAALAYAEQETMHN
jgi:hexokinase